MPSLTEVVKYEIRRNSDRIFKIKEEVSKIPIRKISGALPWFEVYDHIRPGHENWEEYRSLKREVSLLLTGIRIMKLCDVRGKDLVSVIDLPCVKEHTPKKWIPSEGVCTWEHAALRKLRRIDKRLRKNPGDFKKVDAWVQLMAMATRS